MHPESHGVFHQLHLALPAGHNRIHQRLGPGFIISSVIPTNTYNLYLLKNINRKHTHIQTHTSPLQRLPSVGPADQGAQKLTHTLTLTHTHRANGEASLHFSRILFVFLILFFFSTKLHVFFFFFKDVFLLVGDVPLFCLFISILQVC